jgi:hypothetical protein
VKVTHLGKRPEVTRKKMGAIFHSIAFIVIFNIVAIVHSGTT